MRGNGLFDFDEIWWAVYTTLISSRVCLRKLAPRSRRCLATGKTPQNRYFMPNTKAPTAFVESGWISVFKIFFGIRSISTLEVLRNRALRIDIYLLTYTKHVFSIFELNVSFCTSPLWNHFRAVRDSRL